MALWLGLDFGSSAGKALLLDERGRVVARAEHPYPTDVGADGRREQVAQDYLDAARALIAACGHAAEIGAVGLVSQTPTLVLCDDRLRPVRPALTWQDTRAAAEAVELEQRLGDPRQHFATTLHWSAAHPTARLSWLARHEPDVVGRTAVVLQPKDFVGARLTGIAVSDAWSSKGLVEVAHGEPAERALEAAGWSSRVAPEIGRPWEVRGPVTSDAAADFGLRAGTAVTVGWSDALAVMLALGAFARPSALAASGTSDVVGATTKRLPADAAGLYLVPGSCAPLPVVYGPTQTSGAAGRWLAGVLGIDSSELQTLAERADPDDIPIFLPYLGGERAPLWRSDIRAGFLGLDAGHGRAELARAVLVGVACTDRRILELAEAVAGRHEEVRVGGGSATKPAWRAVRASVLGRPLLVREEGEASALGAAMLAASAGDGADLLEAAARLGGPLERYAPTDQEVERGERDYRRFLDASRVVEEGPRTIGRSTPRIGDTR